VESRWHALKAQEKGRASVTEGIPEALPALLRASKVLARSEHLDIPLPEAVDLAADVEDEEAFGDLLLTLVAAGRARGWDAEAALREAVRRQARRIREAEGA
jgi:XTP/dITP diphosphohydrolase